jgi:peptide/nickel transport system permease protein
MDALTIGAAVLVLIIAASVVAHLFGLVQPYAENLAQTLQPPSLHHLFGTDDAGRDVFGRTLYASLLDLEVGVLSTVIPLVVGMALGAIAGYAGGALDTVIMRVMDLILAFPALVLMLGLAAIYGPGLSTVFVGLIVTSLPVFVRLTRGEMLVLREQQFMLAAKTLGLPRKRIMGRHAMPHLLRANLVYGLSNIVGNIGFLVTLSYLGLGVQPPTPEWGAIISEGQQYLLTQWWISTLPGLFMVLVLAALFMAGEALARKLDVKLAGAL